MNNESMPSRPTPGERNRLIWKSFRSLPLWVQIWVAGILVPVNAAAFVLLDTPAGFWTAMAAIFVTLTNGPLVYACCGMNRVLSIPHLIAWIPLQVFLVFRLGAVSPGSGEYIYALLVLTVNGISLVFDLLDSWRWWRGERETPGISS